MVVTGCDLAPCSGKSLVAGGVPLSACCIDETTCGVDIIGCIAIGNVPSEIPVFDAGPSELIVPDPSCPDQSFMGLSLTGCCDRTGVCGVSLPGSDRCLTRAEGGVTPGVDAGPEKACNYPADGG
jgi:hypothetical protein